MIIIIHLNSRASKWELTKDIISVDAVVDKYGEIKDNASPDLLITRRDINSRSRWVNQRVLAYQWPNTTA
jgi:DNA mismatch repair protein MutS2